MNSGILFKIQRYAIHDGPGIRTTLFFKGCPLDCRWCHNPEGKAPAPQRMDARAGGADRCGIIGRFLTVDAAIAEIEKDRIFYDASGGGATFSGGEPLMQAAFLQSLLAACRERDIHTVLDTSGYAPAETFAAICRLTDRVLFDLKIMNDREHRKHTGVSNRQIMGNLNALSVSGVPYRIRFPLIPGITDAMDNIRHMAEHVRSLGTAEGIDILPFHRTADGKYRRLGMANPMENVPPPSPEMIDAACETLEDLGLAAAVGG